MKIILLCSWFCGAAALDGNDIQLHPPSVQSIDKWMDKDRIKNILEATKNPFLRELALGETFELQGTQFNAGELIQVAHCVSWPEDWGQVSFWEVALQSERAAVRFIAYQALLQIHRKKPSINSFDYHLVPTSDSGKEERNRLIKELQESRRILQQIRTPKPR